MKPSIWKSAKRNILLLCMMYLALLTSACATSKRNASARTTAATTRTNSLRQDSTYRRDSIYIREYTRGDTVYLDRWRERWRERVVIRNDTIYQDREVQIQLPPERYVPRAVKVLAWIGAFALFALLLRLLWRLKG